MKLIIALFVFFICVDFPIFSFYENSSASSGSDSVSIDYIFKKEVISDDYEDNTKSESDVKLPWENYTSGPNSAMAVFVTNPNCFWLQLAHGLKTIGVPFLITDNFKKALEHKVVMIYPEINSSSVSLEIFFALREFVHNGGILICMNADGLEMSDVFGYVNSTKSENANKIIFKKTVYKYDDLKYENDKSIIINNNKSATRTMSAIKYLNPVTKPLAVYEDGSAAILENNYGLGKAYTFGIDIGKFLSIGYNGKQTDLSRSYVNKYEPMLDVLLRLIREFYREANGVTLGTCPDGKNLTVIFTHDIDFNQSVINSLVYARFEKEQNITATYFVQTKYIKDWEDEAFFTSENNMILMELPMKNMEVASHTVSHSRSFSNFDSGDFEETQETYKPFVQEKLVTLNGSVSGEVVVSKQLLDSTLNCNVVSFRPGYLSYPKTLPQCLARAGYKYSSSITANDAITHLPFQLNYNREDLQEVPIFEFPITIEDEEGNMLKQLPQYVNLARQISNEDGIMVILIHPNDLGQKLEFEKKFFFELKDKAIFQSIENFGDWWSVRNDVQLEVEGNKIILDSKKPIEGLTLLLPTGASLVIPVLKDHLEIFYSIN